MARRVPERFLVAFSLAGEQRELVKGVAEVVERRLGESTVFYDEWYEHYLAGPDADLKLQKLYGEQCELAVICVSEHYTGKAWTQAEHAAVRARYMRAAASQTDRLRVLALRVGDGQVEGIPLNYIAPDIRDKTIDEAAQLVIDRLGLVASPLAAGGNEAVEWPDAAPEFVWPMADHTEAQDVFCELLTRSSPARFLPIVGVSETGKSHLARQMEQNVAEQLPDLRCARFDFKGTSDRRLELEAFVRSLGLSAVEGSDLNEQLSSALDRLKRDARPTLLIFDTFEDAGDARLWIERVLLAQLLRAEWLRVVTLGQEAPERRGARWESASAAPIRLGLPGPQDWFDYGRLLRPEDTRITLEFVTSVHQLARGKPSTLASLLGPN